MSQSDEKEKTDSNGESFTSADDSLEEEEEEKMTFIGNIEAYILGAILVYIKIDWNIFCRSTNWRRMVRKLIHLWCE